MSDSHPAVDRSPKAMIGTVFAGEFKIVKHVARGDVADTYLAELIDPPTRVGLKVCRPEYSHDRAQAERILREAAVQLQRVGLGEHLHKPAASLALGQQRVVDGFSGRQRHENQFEAVEIAVSQHIRAVIHVILKTNSAHCPVL